MITLVITAGMALTFAVGCMVYYGCNKGMAPRARGQQTRRFLIASVLAWLPAAVAGSAAPGRGMALAALTGVAWAVAYPLLFHLTNRRTSPDYEHYGEIACGIYLFGWLHALWLLGAGCWVLGVVCWLLLMASVAQVVYYALYGTCIDANGMKILQDSHPNEIIEYARSYPLWRVVLVAAAAVALLAGCVWLGRGGGLPAADWRTAVLGAYVAGFGWYVFKPRRGMFVRSGIVCLWLDIREYSALNMRYAELARQRLQTLDVKPLGQPMAQPHTIMMVIGESAARDYMSAFTPRRHDTTPWMRQMAADNGHTLLFPHAYSCAMHTVQALEKALTECSQYNGMAFHQSCSVVDVAHRLGYRVHWYSNQGHLGANDTPVTLVANTADVARWTHQELGRVQYDESLIGFIDELDPAVNNLLVLHLKGSHFNFRNRYPADRAVWGVSGRENEVESFENSLRYTDDVLRQAFDAASGRLNLQAMVYFSDHATVPDRRRSPNFNGFGDTRIPLMVWMSEQWKQLHQPRWDALQRNARQYWTNDLAYELMCGILDVQSPHFDERASLASDTYAYRRDMLLTYEGAAHISDDTDDAADGATCREDGTQPT